MRLHKWLSKSGVCSLRKAEELIATGQVFVDGKRATIGQDIEEGHANIVVSGKRVSKKPAPFVYYMLYKPAGVLCSLGHEQDKRNLKSIAALRRLPMKLNPVGRLDYFSEGLLLMTNDGILCNQLMHPRYKVVKHYRVESNAYLPIEAIQQLRHGVELEDGPVSAEVHLYSPGKPIYKITIAVGRNRIIRRIFEHYGLHVKRLVRVGIGELKLDRDLKPGDLRTLTLAELRYLKASVAPKQPRSPHRERRSEASEESEESSSKTSV